jgi:hypothetical protein
MSNGFCRAAFLDETEVPLVSFTLNSGIAWAFAVVEIKRIAAKNDANKKTKAKFLFIVDRQFTDCSKRIKNPNFYFIIS